MRVLHIIRREADSLVQGIIDHDKGVNAVSIILVQDGVLGKLKGSGEIFASVNDVEARGVCVPYKLIDYPAICQLILEHDKVVVW